MEARRIAYVVVCLICCGMALAETKSTAPPDSTVLRRIDQRIAEYTAVGERLIRQQQEIAETLLRIDGIMFILREQRTEEAARLDSLSRRVKP